MFYSYQNIPINLNGKYMIANELSLSESSQLNPQYFINQRHSYSYTANNGINGNLRLSYYLTGNDFIKRYIDDEVTVISGNIGGIYFNSGYLTSYNINGTPNTPIVSNIEIAFFEELKGVFCAHYDLVAETGILNFSNIEIVNLNSGTLGTIDSIINFNYSFNSEVNPVYRIGDWTPSEISFGRKTISMEIETDNLAPDLPIYGKQAGFKINLKHPSQSGIIENLTCSGILHSRTINSQTEDLIKSNLSIKQNYIESIPIITGFTPQTGSISSYVYIRGSNLINVKKVNFNSLIAGGGESRSFKINSDNEIYARVPNDAFSGPVSVENLYTKISTGLFTVFYPTPTFL